MFNPPLLFQLVFLYKPRVPTGPDWHEANVQGASVVA